MPTNFTDEEKCRLFDKISDMYYKQNFGSTTKSDLDLLIFSTYLEHCLDSNERTDDYTLSKQLGITQTRIRSLKERKELKYPRKNFVWKDSFAREIKNAKYDEKKHLIKLTIQDVNVMTEIQHYIEENGWDYEGSSANKKLLKITLDCFCDVFLDKDNKTFAYSDEERKAIEKLSRNNSDVSDFVKDFTENGLKNFLMQASKTAIVDVLRLLPFGGTAATAFNALANIIKDM